ncbi:1,4-dihydroxy-2-naphthoyl-CoA hydrolase [Parachlamydia acanthamoebae UV-7]|jgi:1,4-dihydroxy-2-naphthoyl-CoA hydrolase|uniref:1,4-dihydroxy-2-naphthoyl-CoA hydrolase n=3 Tax=Parachlamydia acanthamoebae TaxID=83552 RepID=F8KVS5_PARAV|nr:thioesterase family protein [Parachlamydia acanthamoebae]KIA76327.1 1,4-dihydroxy-2-naphthoyl-CoA hydrolase [Parachlamydia acanthamoebae]CCB85211.1 1,4-dihydroxy-2-naphthoyl-CoA hydrolase [Parachlamydia acanthamoebae UV-7]
MYISHNKVRMHDTDMAGILYFPRQFRFAHDALEDWVESEGLGFNQVFHHEKFVFVIVHAEADYLVSLQVGNKLEVHLTIERVGTSAFTVNYRIYKENQQLVGTAKTVHVTLDATTRQKIEIPKKFREILEKHLVA